MHFQCGKAFQEKHKRKTQGHCWVSVGIQLGSGTHSLIMPFLTQYLAQSKHLIILFTLSSYPDCDHWVIVYVLLNNLSVVLNNKCCDDYLCSHIFFLHKFPQSLFLGEESISFQLPLSEMVYWCEPWKLQLHFPMMGFISHRLKPSFLISIWRKNNICRLWCRLFLFSSTERHQLHFVIHQHKQERTESREAWREGCENSWIKDTGCQVF